MYIFKLVHNILTIKERTDTLRHNRGDPKKITFTTEVFVWLHFTGSTSQ